MVAISWGAPGIRDARAQETHDCSTRHLSQSDFLNRCLALDKSLAEPLAQKHLRAMLRAIGTPSDNIDVFRGLKLFDQIVCLAQVAISSGLRLWDSGDEIMARYHADGTDPAQPSGRVRCCGSTWWRGNRWVIAPSSTLTI